MSFPNWNGVKDDRIRVLESDLASARATIAGLEKRIGELEAERGAFREYAHAITKALTGLVGGGSEMFAGRIATGTDREMFRADLPFCVQRIRDRYERSHTALCEAVRREKAAEQALTAERQLREACEITKTEQEIVDDANRLARVFYSMMGYGARVGYRFDEATHPQEQLCWRMSVIAYENLTGTDVENALAELDEAAPPSTTEAENE